MTLDAPTLHRILELPDKERAELARRLILSLESADYDADAEELWAAEIERRLEAVERGETVPVDWRPAVERIRKSLRRRRSR